MVVLPEVQKSVRTNSAVTTTSLSIDPLVASPVLIIALMSTDKGTAVSGLYQGLQ